MHRGFRNSLHLLQPPPDSFLPQPCFWMHLRTVFHCLPRSLIFLLQMPSTQIIVKTYVYWARIRRHISSNLSFQFKRRHTQYPEALPGSYWLVNNMAFRFVAYSSGGETTVIQHKRKAANHHRHPTPINSHEPCIQGLENTLSDTPSESEDIQQKRPRKMPSSPLCDMPGCVGDLDRGHDLWDFLIHLTV